MKNERDCDNMLYGASFCRCRISYSPLIRKNEKCLTILSLWKVWRGQNRIGRIVGTRSGKTLSGKYEIRLEGDFEKNYRTRYSLT